MSLIGPKEIKQHASILWDDYFNKLHAFGVNAPDWEHLLKNADVYGHWKPLDRLHMQEEILRTVAAYEQKVIESNPPRPAPKEGENAFVYGEYPKFISFGPYEDPELLRLGDIIPFCELEERFGRLKEILEPYIFAELKKRLSYAKDWWVIYSSLVPFRLIDNNLRYMVHGDYRVWENPKGALDGKFNRFIALYRAPLLDKSTVLHELTHAFTSTNHLLPGGTFLEKTGLELRYPYGRRLIGETIMEQYTSGLQHFLSNSEQKDRLIEQIKRDPVLLSAFNAYFSSNLLDWLDFIVKHIEKYGVNGVNALLQQLDYQ